MRPHRLVVRTRDFHSRNGGSTPPGDATSLSQTHIPEMQYVSFQQLFQHLPYRYRCFNDQYRARHFCMATSAFALGFTSHL